MPSRTATPTALPDVHRIDIVATGVGSYQLVAVPAAVIHNAATHTGATGVLVHLTPTRHGQPTTPLVTSPIVLYPGQTMVVAANCTDTCNNADGAIVTVDANTWVGLAGSPLTASPASYACRVGCGGHGQGSATATVTGSNLPAGTRVDLFAACTTAAGAIVGGGQRQVSWPQAGGSLSLTVPVIVSAQPATCQVSAST